MVKIISEVNLILFEKIHIHFSRAGQLLYFLIFQNMLQHRASSPIYKNNNNAFPAPSSDALWDFGRLARCHAQGQL